MRRARRTASSNMLVCVCRLLIPGPDLSSPFAALDRGESPSLWGWNDAREPERCAVQSVQHWSKLLNIFRWRKSSLGPAGPSGPSIFFNSERKSSFLERGGSARGLCWSQHDKSKFRSRKLDHLDRRRKTGPRRAFAWTGPWTAWTAIAIERSAVLPGYRSIDHLFKAQATLDEWRDDVETVATCTLSRSFID